MDRGSPARRNDINDDSSLSVELKRFDSMYADTLLDDIQRHVVNLDLLVLIAWSCSIVLKTTVAPTLAVGSLKSLERTALISISVFYGCANLGSPRAAYEDCNTSSC